MLPLKQSEQPGIEYLEQWRLTNFLSVQATKAPAMSSRDMSPKKGPVEEEDAKQNGHEGDMEEDDEELMFDFRKKAPERPEEPFRPPVADTQVQLSFRWSLRSPFSYSGRYDS
jgi:hypothetical protein